MRFQGDIGPAVLLHYFLCLDIYGAFIRDISRQCAAFLYLERTNTNGVLVGERKFYHNRNRSKLALSKASLRFRTPSP